jgi:hypothetical protein
MKLAQTNPSKGAVAARVLPRMARCALDFDAVLKKLSAAAASHAGPASMLMPQSFVLASAGTLGRDGRVPDTSSPAPARAASGRHASLAATRAILQEAGLQASALSTGSPQLAQAFHSLRANPTRESALGSLQILAVRLLWLDARAPAGAATAATTTAGTAVARPGAALAPMPDRDSKVSSLASVAEAPAPAGPLPEPRLSLAQSSLVGPAQGSQDVAATTVVGGAHEHMMVRIEQAVRAALVRGETAALARGIELTLTDAAARPITITVRQDATVLTVAMTAAPDLARLLRERCGELRRRLNNCQVLVRADSPVFGSKKRNTP